MSLSLKSRINASFVAVSLMALCLTFMVFYYLNSLNVNIAEIIDVSNRDRISADQIISSIVTIMKHEKKMKQDGITNETVEQMKVGVEVLVSQLGSIEAKSKDEQIKEVIKGMLAQNDKIKNLLAKISIGQESRVDPGDVMDPEIDIDNAGNKDALRPLAHGEGTNFGQIVDKKAIAVSAVAVSKTYGDTDPALTYTVTSGSLLSGDGFSGEITRAPGSSVATYAITQGTLALSGSYDLTFVDATLTITCLLYTSPSPRDRQKSRMPSSA